MFDSVVQINPEDKEKVGSVVKDTLAWIDGQEGLPEVSECEIKQKEIEAIIHPIMTKIYAQQGQQPSDES